MTVGWLPGLQPTSGRAQMTRYQKEVRHGRW